LDYLKNRAKSGDMAVLQLTFRKMSLGKCPKIDLATGASLLYILKLGTCSKFARKNDFLALGVCFPQPCSRALAAALPRQDHFCSTTDKSFRFHKKNSMKCVVIWIPLRIRVCSRNTQPRLNKNLQYKWPFTRNK